MRLAAILLICAAACAHAPPREVVWPPPPNTARIRFVTTVHATEDLDPGGWSALRRILTGARQDAGMIQPLSVAVSTDGQRLYLADFTSSAIFVADFEAHKVSVFARDALQGRPFGVALDADENVYVTESTGPSVVVFDRRGAVLRRFGAVEKLERPTGIAVDAQRRLVYVVDTASQASVNHRVLAYTFDGRLHHLVGGVPDAPPRGEADGQFQFPVYVTVRSDGNVFVADTMNFRVQIFDPDGHFVSKFGEPGDVPGTFSRIKGLAFDRFGNLYVADGDHSVVQIFNRDLQPLMYFGAFSGAPEDFEVPAGIAIFAPTNRIYVCNEHRGRINVYELINTTEKDSLEARQ